MMKLIRWQKFRVGNYLEFRISSLDTLREGEVWIVKYCEYGLHTWVQ